MWSSESHQTQWMPRQPPCSTPVSCYQIVPDLQIKERPVAAVLEGNGTPCTLVHTSANEQDTRNDVVEVHTTVDTWSILSIHTGAMSKGKMFQPQKSSSVITNFATDKGLVWMFYTCLMLLRDCSVSSGSCDDICVRIEGGLDRNVHELE